MLALSSSFTVFANPPIQLDALLTGTNKKEAEDQALSTCKDADCAIIASDCNTES